MRAGIPLADQPNLPARKLDMILAITDAYAEMAQEQHDAGASQSSDGSGTVIVRTPLR